MHFTTCIFVNFRLKISSHSLNERTNGNNNNNVDTTVYRTIAIALNLMDFPYYIRTSPDKRKSILWICGFNWKTIWLCVVHQFLCSSFSSLVHINALYSRYNNMESVIAMAPSNKTRSFPMKMTETLRRETCFRIYGFYGTEMNEYYGDASVFFFFSYLSLTLFLSCRCISR